MGSVLRDPVVVMMGEPCTGSSFLEIRRDTSF